MQGVPLVARVIGGLLRKKQPNEWHSILRKGISNISGRESDYIGKILQLSFDNLHSPSLKKCFTYCSLFEKSSSMEKNNLIQLWMAEGFLQPESNRDDIEIGNECINCLIESSLLHEVIDEGEEYELVQMHDLAQSIISNPKKDLKYVKEDDRYLVIDSFGDETKKLPKLRMLGTLFLGSSMGEDRLITRFKYLHVLKVSSVSRLEIPSSICKLIHLRYLGVYGSVIKAMPESISKLYNLQTLRIQESVGLNALPKGMTKLISLRHLHHDKYVSLPPNIGSLTNLQTLEHFAISEENLIEELGSLKYLRGNLTLCFLNGVSSREDAQRAGWIACHLIGGKEM